LQGQRPRLGWRPSALLGLFVLFCIIARPSAPVSSSLHSLLAGARARAGAQARARAPAPKSTRAAAASSGGVMYLLWSRAGAGAQVPRR